MLRWLGLMLVLAACRETAEQPSPVDADFDGVLAADDCNDSDPLINPNATEQCDGIDNNCSGVVDDVVDGTTYYIDLDEDGFGNDAVAVQACDPPDGYVGSGGDCDDLDEQAYPGAPEPDCTDSRDLNCDGSVGFADADDDGFAACEDCDDGDPDIRPSAEEACDGVDNNCDDTIDEPTAVDAALWYADDDDDAFGDARDVVLACAAPVGYVADNTDCNDDSDRAHPGLSEVCDGLDNDCDSELDEADAIDATFAFPDVDNDGFGSEGVSIRVCDLPDGFRLVSGDCDDSRADINPDATEVCDDVDNNCNNQADEGFDRTWYADADRDGFGIGTLVLDACEPGAGWSRVTGDCDDALADVNPDATEVCDGVDNNCLGDVDEGFDQDGDGFTTCGGDCDDDNPLRSPGNTEQCDDLDRDCVDGPFNVPRDDQPRWYVDGDLDGFGSDAIPPTIDCVAPEGFVDTAGDCDDSSDQVYTGAPTGCDGVDYDCDGFIDNDDDEDGFSDLTCGGLDCDDSDEAVFPGEPGCALDQSCATILSNGLADQDDFYEIDPDGAEGPDLPFTVYCDMTGGGITRPSPGGSFRVDYSGQPVSLPVPTDASARFEFVLYGASGGNGQDNNGGPGGRTTGAVQVEPGDSLTVFVGGIGASGGGADSGNCYTRTGGYNGGGTGSRGGSGGGGATDVRLSGTALSDRVLVAGGGGGCGREDCDDAGGAGGGTQGATGGGSNPGSGGTQTAGGSGSNPGVFGQGGSSTNCNDNGGGGGGWYGGGAGASSNATGGGGSGYTAGIVLNPETNTSSHRGNGYLEYVYR